MALLHEQQIDNIILSECYLKVDYIETLPTGSLLGIVSVYPSQTLREENRGVLRTYLIREFDDENEVDKTKVLYEQLKQKREYLNAVDV